MLRISASATENVYQTDNHPRLQEVRPLANPAIPINGLFFICFTLGADIVCL